MAPAPGSWEPAWEEVAAVLAAAVAYAAAVRRTRIERWRLAAFGLALVLVVAVLVSPLETLALHYFLWAHLVQNVALAEWAPALAVIGLGPALGLQIGRSWIVRAITTPAICWSASGAMPHKRGAFS